MLKMTVAELEALFTANTAQIEQAEKKVEQTGKRIESKPITTKVDADPRGALDGMDRVQDAAKKLVSERAVLKLDADITRAEKNLERARDRLEDLHVRAEGGLDVTADVKRAESSIQRLERHLDGLRSARTVVDVDADPVPAQSRLERFLKLFKKDAADAGAESGRSLTDGLDAATRGAGEKVGKVVGGDIEDTLVSALAAIPIAGGIVLAGVAIGKSIVGAIQSGLGVEAGRDRLAALTGLGEVDAARIANAAGEAYANVFGESIEQNMDTARLALQFKLIDQNSSVDEAKAVIEGLAGIADVLDEDVKPTATAVTTLLRSGLARSAKDAFDILAAGARNGLNRNDDLLDTLTEYPVVLGKLGLSAQQMLGLLNQGLQKGARNTDVVADALKEFQIRATDASTSSASGFRTLGLSAEEMTAKIAAGGDGAREGLQQVLDLLRSTEDPVARNAAAVALFGTKAEDLGDALFALDLSSAVEQLGTVTGAAQQMFDTLSGNDQHKIDQAQRNIEVAVQGIQGALATVFAEPLGDFADWVSQNRGPLLQFFSDLVNGAIDFGVTATKSFGDFVSGPLAAVVEGVAGVIDVFNGNEGRPKELDDLAASMRDFKGTTEQAVTGLELMRGKFNDFAGSQIELGYLNDASLRLADSISKVGSEQGSMESQVRSAVAALSDQISVAARAGEQQGDLTDRYAAGTQALVDQMIQAGLSEEAARALIDTVMRTPAEQTTTFSSNAVEEQGRVQALADRVSSLPDGSVFISAETDEAQQAMDRLVRTNSGREVRIRVLTDGSLQLPGGRVATLQAQGAVVEFMAQGGVRGLSPMQPVAQMVPPNTWRVVGDRGDVPELYAPLDGSARSWALLMEGVRRMPGTLPMAEGAVVATRPMPPGSDANISFGDVVIRGDGLSTTEVMSMVRQGVREALREALREAGG